MEREQRREIYYLTSSSTWTTHGVGFINILLRLSKIIGQFVWQILLFCVLDDNVHKIIKFATC